MIDLNELFSFWLRCLAAIFLLGSSLYLVLGIIFVALEKDSVSVKWCGACVLWLWLASAGFHALMLMGLFSLYPAMIGMAALLLVVSFRGIPPCDVVSIISGDIGTAINWFVKEIRPRDKLLLLLLFAGSLCLMARVLLLPPLSWDGLHYHLVKAGLWVQNGYPWLMEGPGAWSGKRGFSGGGEAFHAWAMLPFNSDFVTGFMDYGHWIFLMLAAFTLGRLIGLARYSAMGAAIFCGFTPAIWLAVGACYVDLPLTLSSILATTFGIKYLEDKDLIHLVLSFLALGVAGGIKVFAYPVIAVVLLVTLSQMAWTRCSVWRKMGILGFCLGSIGAIVFPWFYYNYIMTGYILYPFPIKIAGVTLGVKSAALEFAVASPELQNYGLWSEIIALKNLINYPGIAIFKEMTPNLGVVSLVPLALAPVGFMKLAKMNKRKTVLLCSIITVVILFYFHPNLTGFRMRSAHTMARYLFAAYILVVMVSPLALREHHQENYAEFLLLMSFCYFVLGVYLHWRYFEFPYIIVTAWYLILMGGLFLFLHRKYNSPKLFIVFLMVFTVFLSAVFSERLSIRYKSAPYSYFFHNFPRYWVDASRTVDQPKYNRKIAMTAGPDATEGIFPYLFMGSNLQNTIHYFPIDEKNVASPTESAINHAVQQNYKTWLSKLRDHGISEVMSFRPRSVEFEWMERDPYVFEKISGDGTYGLFRITDHR